MTTEPKWHELPEICRPQDIAAHNVEDAVVDRTLRVRWGGDGKFIDIVGYEETRGVLGTLKRLLRKVFNRHFV